MLRVTRLVRNNNINASSVVRRNTLKLLNAPWSRPNCLSSRRSNPKNKTNDPRLTTAATRSSSTTTMIPPMLRSNSRWNNGSHVYPPTSNAIHKQSIRTYIYFPTSWKELEIRLRAYGLFMDNIKNHCRQVNVKLLSFPKRQAKQQYISSAPNWTGARIRQKPIEQRNKLMLKMTKNYSKKLGWKKMNRYNCNYLRKTKKASAIAAREHGARLLFIQKKQQPYITAAAIQYAKWKNRKIFIASSFLSNYNRMLNNVTLNNNTASIVSYYKSKMNHYRMQYNRRKMTLRNKIKMSSNRSKKVFLDSSIRVQRSIQNTIHRMINAGRRYRYKKSDNTKYIVQPVALTEYSLSTWFDPTTGRPITSQDETGRYVNPWMSLSTDGVQSLFAIIQWQIDRFLRRYLLHSNDYVTNDSNKLANTTTNTTIVANVDPEELFEKRPEQTNQKRENNDLTKKISKNEDDMMPAKSNAVIVKNYHEDQLDGTTPNNDNSGSRGLTLQWIGHSTCLLRDNDTGVTVLTDPVFSDRASPFQNLPFIGMVRDVQPIPSCVTQLVADNNSNQIDFVLISHDHYDHLDKSTCQQLQQFNIVRYWIVPMGLSSWLQEKAHVPKESIIELEWWESVQLSRKKQQRGITSSNATTTNNDTIFYRNRDDDDVRMKWEIIDRRKLANCPTHPALLGEEEDLRQRQRQEREQKSASVWISCLPVQHWCSRTFFDRNYRLWCSFAIFFQQEQQHQEPKRKSKNVTLYKKFYFGGDTALPKTFPLFQQIRDFIGGHVDLAALPIGAYEPNFFMQDAHMNPEEAVSVHQILNSKQSIGIHWGTFPLSEEPMYEPPIRLQKALMKQQQLSGSMVNSFATLQVGDAITVTDCGNEDDMPNLAMAEEEDDVYDYYYDEDDDQVAASS